MTPVTQDNWQPGTPPGGRRRTQHPTAENPFEEPEQSPELRQERSPDLYGRQTPSGISRFGTQNQLLRP